MDDSTFHDREVGSTEGQGISSTLGWLSVGLGVSELLAPRMLARLIGVSPDGLAPAVLRAFGLRGIAVGVGALARPRKPGPLWMRVLGDALDIGSLAFAARGKRASRGRAGIALAALAGVAAVDFLAAKRLSAVAVPTRPIVYAVTINRTPDEVYAFFRKLENLPLFMDFLESVTVLSDDRSRWVARLPVGGSVSWEAAITEDVPGKRLSWRSDGSALLSHKGTVTFQRAPGRDSTEVRVAMQLGVGGLKPSAKLAKIVSKAQMKGDLRRLKQVMETGEVLFSDASSHKGRHPAQPSKDGTKQATEKAARSQSATKEGGLR